MVGTRGKGSKLKSKGLALVPDEPEPLKVIEAEAAVIVEAADGMEGNYEVLNSEVVPVFGGRHEEKQMMFQMLDVEENMGFEINDMIVDGNKAVLTHLDEEDKLEGVSHSYYAVTNMDVGNNEINVEEPVEDMIKEDDLASNVEAENNNKRTSEDLRTREEEKGPDVSACGTTANKGLAASEDMIVESLTVNLDNDKEANAEEPASAPDGIGDISITESEIPVNEVKAVADQVTQAKKKIVRKKLVKKNTTLLGKDVVNANEALPASEDMVLESLTANLDNDKEANELTTEEPASAPAGNGDESIKEDEIPVNEVKAVADKVPPAKKKIVRKKMIKKNKTLLGKDLVNANEGLSASEHMIVENSTENMENYKEAKEMTVGEPLSTPAENGDESIKQNESPANNAKAVAEEVMQPKKQVVKKKLIKKKILRGKGVANANEGSAAAEPVLVENLTENMENDKEVIELTAEQPGASPAENGDEAIKENANLANEKAVAEVVIQPKKKIVRKKLIKKRILLNSDVSCKAGTSNEVKQQCLEDNDATDEAIKLEDIENVNDEENVEEKPLVKVNKKLNRIRKWKPQGESGVQNEQTPKPTNDESASKENQTIEQKVKGEEAVMSKSRRNRLKKRKNKMVVEEGTQNVDAKDIDNPGSSKNGKLPKKLESMGMIFMCSSETKKDCYRYKVFGLPAGKKDIVSRIYKGMRLFLFDVDLKMLYGIYKAAGPGTSNIEPKAFKSKFPSQVRFNVLEDCLPIAEEKFKKVIKDNYYTKNKFDCQLTQEQVKNLCKLFNETTKKSESIRGVRTQRVIEPTRGDRKRKRAENSRTAVSGPISSRDREKRRKGPEQVRYAPVVRNQEMGRALVVRGHEQLGRAHVVRGQEQMARALVVRGREETRPAPVVIDERYRHPVVLYERESYRPPVASSSLYQPLRADNPPRTRIYSYERDPGVADTYRRDPALEYRDLGISSPRERRDPAEYRDIGILAPWERRDPILEYRDLGISAPQESRRYSERSLNDTYATYREPQVYRETAYDTNARREHYDYLSTGVRYPEYPRSDDHRPPLPLHRRY